MVVRIKNGFVAINRFVDGLVHSSVVESELDSLRHRNFIATNLLGGLAAMVFLPLSLAIAGPTSLAVTIVLAWLLGQLPLAMFLSRTGALEMAHMISAAMFTTFVGAMAALSGGVHSFAIVWLAIAPLEAALSGSRRVIAGVLAFCALVVAALTLGESGFSQGSGILSVAGGVGGPYLTAFSTVAALCYAGMIALRIDWDARQKQSLISEQERKFRLVAENACDLITVINASGELTFASPAIQSVLGISPAQAQRNGLFERVHVADRPVFLKAISDAAVEKRELQIEFRARQGETRPGNLGGVQYVWLEMTCRKLMGSESGVGGQNAEGVVAVIRDISLRKSKDEELQETREVVEAASASKTRFLANVSHELRTPLNAIIGFSDFLSNAPHIMSDPVRGREYVELINESGKHLLQVVDDVLDMSKIETGNFELTVSAFDVGKCLESCVRMMAGQAQNADVELNLKVSADVGEFPADQRACKQIILNLLSNAIKFTGKGGRVDLEAYRDGEDLLLFVRDNGIGIAAQDVKRLGVPFFQVNSDFDRSHQGTGLGLSMVKGLCELHGGSVKFESEIDRGTCAAVRLPTPEKLRAGRTVVPVRSNIETPAHIAPAEGEAGRGASVFKSDGKRARATFGRARGAA